MVWSWIGLDWFGLVLPAMACVLLRPHATAAFRISFRRFFPQEAGGNYLFSLCEDFNHFHCRKPTENFLFRFAVGEGRALEPFPPRRNDGTEVTYISRFQRSTENCVFSVFYELSFRTAALCLPLRPDDFGNGERLLNVVFQKFHSQHVVVSSF